MTSLHIFFFALLLPFQSIASSIPLLVKDSPKCGKIYFLDEQNWDKEGKEFYADPGEIILTSKGRPTFKTPYGEVFLKLPQELSSPSKKDAYNIMDTILNQKLIHLVETRFTQEMKIFKTVDTTKYPHVGEIEELFLEVKNLLLEPPLDSVKAHNKMLISLFQNSVQDIYHSQDNEIRSLLCRYGKKNQIKNRNKKLSMVGGLLALISGVTAISAGVTMVAAPPVLFAIGVIAGVIGTGSGGFDVYVAHKDIKTREKTARIAQKMIKIKKKFSKQVNRIKSLPLKEKRDLNEEEETLHLLLSSAKDQSFDGMDKSKLWRVILGKKYINRANYAIGIIKVLSGPAGIIPHLL